MLTKLRKLELDANPKLRGTIPTQLGKLTQLTHLNLRELVYINGTLPTQFGRLTKLITFRLGFDYSSRGRRLPVTGTIPTEYGELVEMAELEITGTRVRGTIPTQLGRMTKLTNLYLKFNNLSGTIPGEVRAIESLEKMYTDGNPLLIMGKVLLFYYRFKRSQCSFSTLTKIYYYSALHFIASGIIIYFQQIKWGKN